MSLTLAKEGVKHEAKEGEPMKAGKGGSEPFIVAPEATEARRPGKRAFDDPAPGQQDEAAFGLGEFDDDQIDAGARRRGGRLHARVALIDIAELDVLAGDGLHLCRQLADLRALLQRWPG